MNPPNQTKHLARKRFGQHFLKDPRILDRIVSAFAPENRQNIVEIGPGLGALTEALLERIDHLIAIELDRDLAAELKRKFSPDRLTVHELDVLDCDFSTLQKKEEKKLFRVIGNLPYNISTPLIFHMLDQINQIEDMLFMLQKEVALRLSAKPGSKHYGRLSVMTALEVSCEIEINVPPEAFDPAPKVDSTVVRLIPKRKSAIAFNRPHLSHLVRTAFGQRRKTLRNALKGVVTPEDFEVAHIDSSLRAELISPDEYVRLSEICLSQD